MSNTISFIIRAIDRTKAGVNSAKGELKGLAKAFGGGGIAGMLGRGAILGALVLSGRAVARWADEIRRDTTGLFDGFTHSAADALGRTSNFFNEWGRQFKARTVELAGYWAKLFSGEITFMGKEKGGLLPELPARDPAKDAETRKAIDAEKEKRMSADDLMRIREKEMRAADSARSRKRDDLDLELDYQKKLNAYNDARLAVDKERAAVAKEAERRAQEAAEKEKELAEAASQAAEKAAEAAVKQRQKIIARALDVAEARTQGAGMAIFAGGRRITAAQSAAMGARVAALRGDDPQKQQRETNIILRDIWRFLGGGK